jgi:hypothetical protein
VKVEDPSEAGAFQQYAKLGDPLVRLRRDEDSTPGTVDLEAMDGLFLVENPEVIVDDEGHWPPDSMESRHPEVVQCVGLYVIHEPVMRLEQVP